MGRPRKTRTYLPKYVSVIGASYWYRPPGQKPLRVSKVGDDAALFRFMADKSDPAKVPGSLIDVFDRYEREVLPGLQERTQKDYRRYLVVLRKVFGHMRPDDVTPRDIGQFLSVEKGKIHRNRQVALLSAVYGKAVGRWFCAERNPCLHVERNPAGKRTRYVTDGEFEAFRQRVSPRMRIAMDLALLTGQRQGDLLTLKWSSVTPEGIQFQQGKTGKRLLVAMSPALQEVLARAKALTPNIPREYVLRRGDGQPYSENGFRAIWQRAMAAYGKEAARFTFHDLRAKSASDASGLQDAYERLGHTSQAMTRGVYDRGVRTVRPLR
jgi:integrase